MAIGVLAVLSLSGATMIEYANSNTRTSEYSKDNNGAYVLAEAGLNEMLGILFKKGNNPMNASLLGTNTTVYEEGTVTWTGTLDTLQAVWSLSSTGKIKNTSGQSGDVARTLTAKVPVTPLLQQPVANPSWNYIFATRTGNLCDETLTNAVTMTSPLFVMGNLCLANGARITGSPLVVKGNLDMAQPENEVGSSTQPIGEAHLAGQCQWYNQPWHTPCSSVDHVYATILDQIPPAISPPVPEWDYWYANAIPGPKYDCTSKTGTVPAFESAGNTARDNSLATVFNLTPSSSYSCKYGPPANPIGEISWDVTSRTLTINGTLFIDGSVKVEVPGATPPMNTYNGNATLYLSGHFYTTNKQKLCAVADGTTCAWSGGWNPNTEMLTIVANGPGGITGVASGTSIQLNNETVFQGSLYATNAIQLGGSSRVEGPMIGGQVIMGSGSIFDSWGSFAAGPVGMPGNEAVVAQPNPPQLYSG